MTNEYSIAYSEVLTILDKMNEDYKNKIPPRLIEYFRFHSDPNHKILIDTKIPLKQNNLNKYTLPLLAMLLINYWCSTKEEKDELVRLYFENEKKYQEELNQKYNPDLLFKK